MSETTKQVNGIPAPLADAEPAEAASVLASPAEPTPAPVEPPSVEPSFYFRGLTAVTSVVLLVVLLIYLLDRCAFLLKPLLIACLLSFLISPLERWFARQGLPRWPAALLLLVTSLTLMVGLGALAYSGLNALDVDRLGEYERQLDRQGQRLLARAGFEEQAEEFRVRQLLFSEQGLNIRLRDTLASLTGTFFSFVTTSVIVALYLIFLWLERADLPRRIDAALGPDRGAAIREVASQINHSVSRYLGVLTLLCLSQAVVAAVTLGLLGVDFFALWAVLIFLLCFIPYFGPFVSISLPVLLTFMEYPDQPWRGVVALVVLVSVNQTCDNFLNPRLNGERLGVSPLLILVAITFWGWMWGVVGMILAVPLTVTIKLILERIDATRPIATLMSNH
jgi:predicted PurR-regulated permease PerM